MANVPLNLPLLLIIHLITVSPLVYAQQRYSTSTSTTKRYPTDSREEILGFINAATRRTTTTTTYRPLPDLDYDNNGGPHQPTTSRWTDPTTSTTRAWQYPRPNLDYTSQRPSSQIDYSRNRIAPSVNFTVIDAKRTIVNTTWNSTAKEATISLRTYRQFTLTFSCNASYPVEWLSQTSFGTNMWEVEEIRHFENIRASRATGIISNNFYPAQVPLAETQVVYTAVLKLTFEKSEMVPNSLKLSCGRARKSLKRNDIQKQTVVGISMDANSTMHVGITRDAPPIWSEHVPGTLPGPPVVLPYHEALGANKDCHVLLRWKEDDAMFECISEESDTQNRNYNLTIDYFDFQINCYDVASCERAYTNSRERTMGCSWSDEGVWRNSRKKFRMPLDMWAKASAPSAGVVYCKRNEEPEDQWDALHFFHSLPEICPGDEPATRQALFIAQRSNTHISENVLRRDFMSFCWTRQTYDSSFKDMTLYAGENVTVTCIASVYHFAKGTRIGTMDNDGYVRYVKTSDITIESNKVQGCFNFTAKVQIQTAQVTKLFCETYLKQSTDSVRKVIPVTVRVPTNVSFVGENQVTASNYTGQDGFQLRCEAKGDPEPVISWKKQGRPIPEVIEQITTQEENSVLSILSFPALDTTSDSDSPRRKAQAPFSVEDLQGTYTCEAESKLDRASRTFYVSSNKTSIPTEPLPPPSPDGSSSLWVLWVVLPIFALAVIAVILFLVWKIKMQSKELRLLSKAEVDEFIFGKPEFLQHHASSEEVNNYAPFLPYNRCYEIGKEQLEIDENAVLGSGAYAIVLRGLLTKKDGDKVKVAIKTSRTMDDISLFKALLSELKIMGFIGTHPNIVNLLGAHTKNIQNREIFIAIEYCENGNLLSYLRDHRNRFKNMVGQNGDYDFIPGSLETVSRESFVDPGKGLNTVTLIKWAYEIATGMEFLSKKKVIHGDLAARNILLNEHLIAKIGDFGLSRQLFEYANYIKKQQSPLPWKWLAIECLQDMRFSVKSDVWAYAILLFEIFSLGQVPYPGHSYNDEFLDALINGKRPNRPSHATNTIYNFMTTCWKDKSEDRPNFPQVREFFNKLLYELVPPEYLDLHEMVTLAPPPHPAANATTTITTAQVHEIPTQSAKLNTTEKTSEGKQPRFSFNLNTITAKFHRN